MNFFLSKFTMLLYTATIACIGVSAQYNVAGKAIFIRVLPEVQISNIQLNDMEFSANMSQTAMRMWPDSFMITGDKQPKWRYDQGVILKGMDDVWNATGDRTWFNYIQKSMDYYVGEDGSIKGYKKDEYNIDHVNNGKILLMLYQVTGKEKYRKAAQLLREQLLTHPRTKEGGFWHKKIYPSQMWLDGLYMG
ncbi:MAG: glycoside hydrolase family 88 protein, partial [bacterium]